MEFVKCLCVLLGRRRGEYMIGLGLGFTNPMGGVLDVGLCLGCVGGELVGVLEQGVEEWGGVMSGLFV